MILVLRKSDRAIIATCDTIKEARVARKEAGCATTTEIVGACAYKPQGKR